eukprot:CAMPEP_0194351100 /NCGR_PEP_ID=MMETSP0171-20130528/107990_1 /TAXON_ID=218684 /ORGANISM="Corethron pennatum, Strain L29A3" /LENGTH=857 /DNA_ID=CAMNT_0039118699 /DNA_START=190 /DNA_END=2763 /DNA_ORIENTATION=+
MAEDARRAKNGVLTSPRSVVPTQLFPPDQIPQIPTSLTPQTIFEGHLYDRNGDIHDEPLYDKDGLMVYAGREKTTCVASTENERKISTSPTSVVPLHFFSSDQTEISTASPAYPTKFTTAPPKKTKKNLTAPPEDPEAHGTYTLTLMEHAAIFEVEERKAFLTCHFIMDPEHFSSTRFGLELQPLEDDMLSTDDDDINLFWSTFWREWHDIGVILENRYPPEEIKSLLSPWATWEDWTTDDLFRKHIEFLADQEDAENLHAMICSEKEVLPGLLYDENDLRKVASNQEASENSEASPAYTKKISTAPPESEKQILTAPLDIPTESPTITTEILTAPPESTTENTTASPQIPTPPELFLVQGLLLDNFSEKEANSPPIEEYFDREIVNFQQEIDKVLSEDDDDKEILVDGRLYDDDGNEKFYDGDKICDGGYYNNDKEFPFDGAGNFYKEDQLLFDGKLFDGDGVSSTTSRKDMTEEWTAPPKHSTAPPANTMELLTAQPTENEDDFPEANQRFIDGIIFNGDGDSTDSRESVLGVESRRQKFYDENRGHQKLCDNRDLDGDKQKFLFDGKLFDGNGARQQVHDNEKVDKEQIHDDIFGDNSTHEKQPAAPATMIPTTLSTEHKESVLDINRTKKKEISAGDTSFDEKQPPTPAKLTKPTAAPAKDGIISTKSRGSVLDVLRNRRDSFDEHFSDDSPTGGDAWSTKKKKKKKEKLPRFRSDGTPNRPMRRLIRLYDGATSDDSAEATKASPVVVNSLSAWREEKYHGDGGVPHSDQMNFDHDGAYYGDGDHNFHSERQYFQEGEQHFYNNEDQHFNNDDTDFYDGDGEFHGGHDNLDDGAEQSFYHNEYDGKHFADDY